MFLKCPPCAQQWDGKVVRQSLSLQENHILRKEIVSNELIMLCDSVTSSLRKRHLQSGITILKETKPVNGKVEIKTESFFFKVKPDLFICLFVYFFLYYKVWVSALAFYCTFHNTTKATPEEASCFVIDKYAHSSGPEASINAEKHWQDSSTLPSTASDSPETRWSHSQKTGSPSHPWCPQVIVVMA